jgi:uncharacterized membrane protein
MTRRWAVIFGLVLVLVSVCLALWAYHVLPERVPTHWDLNGHVNGYSSKLFGVALMPIIMAFTWLLMLALPAISPRGFRLDQSSSAFYLTNVAILLVVLALNVIILGAQLGFYSTPGTLLFIPIGVLLVVLGSQMGKFSKNFFIGVRTPWTLASDEVWRRTNRLGGQLCVAGGLLLIALSFFTRLAVPALVAVVLTVAVVPIAYSYVLYKRIEGFGGNET